MSITVPSGIVNYGTLGQNLIPQICWWRGQASVDLALPCEIDWGSSGGSGVTAPGVQLNIGAQLTNQNFGVLQSLYVNNNESSVDVSFIAPETQFKLDVPAGGSGIFPFLSLAGNFYIVPGAGAGAADKTFFTCLNFYPPPVAIEKNFFSTAAAQAGVALTAGTTNLIAAGINGTLEGLAVTGSAENGANYTGTITIEDGAGNLIFSASIGTVSGNTNVIIFPFIDQGGINLRFVNGVKIVVAVTSGGAPAGYFNVMGFYH